MYTKKYLKIMNAIRFSTLLLTLFLGSISAAAQPNKKVQPALNKFLNTEFMLKYRDLRISAESTVMQLQSNPGNLSTAELYSLRSAYDPLLQSVRLEVADDGVGIPAQDRGRVFAPYFSTKDHGTGLGLAIVSRIVSDHHGYIRVQENEPRGARFVLELPATRAEAERGAAAVELAPGGPR